MLMSQNHKDWIRNGNVSGLQTDKGAYTIIYGLHSQPGNPGQIPQSIDGCFIETCNLNWVDNPLVSFEKARNHPQFGPFFQNLEERKIPVYFTDLSYKWKFPKIESLERTIALSQGATSILAAAGGYFAPSPILAGLAYGAALWLALPATYLGIDEVLTSLEEDHVGAGMPAVITRNISKIHPEYYIFIRTLRNKVMAYKEKWLAQNCANSQMVTLCGSGHVGIENELGTSNESILRYLRRLSPLIKAMVKPKTFFSICRFDFDGKTWNNSQMHEIQELKEIVS